MHCACALMGFHLNLPGIRGAYVFEYDSESYLDHPLPFVLANQ